MYTVQFTEEACRDVRSVGGKAAGLADMVAAGLPVAPGYAVTAEAYRAYLAQHGLLESTSRILDRLGRTHDQGAFEEAEREIAELVSAAPVPDEVATEVRAAYRRLCEDTGVPDVAVAVRSSATAEDSVGASFAGEFETWVDVVGEDAVLEHVARCYRSVFSGRVLSYLAEKGISPHAIEMAVVIQKTVRARAAGVMFTLSPTSGDRSKVALEASWGLGLSVVGGEVTPDRFLVDKVGLAIVERTLGRKLIEYRRGDAPVPVAEERQHVPCLSDEEITALAQLGKRLEKIHGAPQDIEFALDEELPAGANVILLQCRPETVWSSAQRKPAFDASAGMMSWITGSISGAPAGGGAVGHRHESKAS
ncbi:PEP/pyruvate-binding domain-containing protein [Georgenia sp. SYP-B2076]|uniref:PEP/pyruvate-binding domain-containing protein n=1 Tax=Georgenia sp. SYP-B2076 TaxID=2495881 RepID=UPI000F8CF7D2|nr:PEP/pyruvate-binding domain-containing protein [Georgenia sp. SYP-B2076]